MTQTCGNPACANPVEGRRVYCSQKCKDRAHYLRHKDWHIAFMRDYKRNYRRVRAAARRAAKAQLEHEIIDMARRRGAEEAIAAIQSHITASEEQA